MQEIWVQSLSWEEPLEKGMATYASILVWEIPDGLRNFSGNSLEENLEVKELNYFGMTGGSQVHWVCNFCPSQNRELHL